MIEMSFEEILGHLTDEAYVTLIQRKERYPEPEHLEIGFSSGSKESSVSYFLWIQVSMSEKDKLTEYMKELR